MTLLSSLRARNYSQARQPIVWKVPVFLRKEYDYNYEIVDFVVLKLLLLLKVNKYLPIWSGLVEKHEDSYHFGRRGDLTIKKRRSFHGVDFFEASRKLCSSFVWIVRKTSPLSLAFLCLRL